MKILLGGIPLGCDNIGDEAILAGVAGMLKAGLPGVELAVATADPATGPLLGVGTVPPYGFAGVPADGFADAVRAHDAYVWCGATGLSDYPHTGLDLLEAAQRAGVPAYVWGVGMDDELNPVFFRAAGRRRALLAATGLLGIYERRLRARLARRIARILPRCRGVWLRDPQSAEMLARTGYPGAGVTADSALLLAPPPRPAAASPRHRLGLCISTQRQVSDLDGVRRLADAVRAEGGEVLGIPMNPKTDRGLLSRLGVDCMEGDTPDAVMAAAASCDVVVSSRLHLLILAAMAGTPGIGVARGSKIANWLANFGETPAGSVADCDWGAVLARVREAFRSPGDWPVRRDVAFARLRARFDAARADFLARLAAP
ncbi:MAG: polysaccharide pyruvyl transferase family protein [Kiritimatiellae bacterium]|nr:polysaccharide pyruvyl transferase family protein [Kiritimatiellia bacterium]